MVAERRAISSLTETYEGDMRSCLNTLQFMQKKSVDVTMMALSTMKESLGKNDTAKGFFRIWEELFFFDSKTGGTKISMNFMDRLCKTLETVNENEKIMQGLYLN